MKFGVEIECFMRADLDEDALEIIMDIEGLGKDWELHSDSSLEHVTLYGHEFVSKPFQDTEKSFQKIRNLCDFLKKYKSKTNSSCGLHVHVDATHLKPHDIRAIIVRYQQQEKYIDTFFPRNRRGNANGYCQSMATCVIDSEHTDMTQFATHFNHYNERYNKVNPAAYLEHGTIEFRQHEGTLDADEIINWIQFCIGFVKQSKKMSTQFVALPKTDTVELITLQDIYSNWIRCYNKTILDYFNTDLLKYIDLIENNKLIYKVIHKSYSIYDLAYEYTIPCKWTWGLTRAELIDLHRSISDSQQIMNNISNFNANLDLFNSEAQAFIKVYKETTRSNSVHMSELNMYKDRIITGLKIMIASKSNKTFNNKILINSNNQNKLTKSLIPQPIKNDNVFIGIKPEVSAFIEQKRLKFQKVKHAHIADIL